MDSNTSLLIGQIVLPRSLQNWVPQLTSSHQISRETKIHWWWLPSLIRNSEGWNVATRAPQIIPSCHRRTLSKFRENGEYGKHGKHQPDDLKHSIGCTAAYISAIIGTNIYPLEIWSPIIVFIQKLSVLIQNLLDSFASPIIAIVAVVVATTKGAHHEVFHLRELKGGQKLRIVKIGINVLDF